MFTKVLRNDPSSACVYGPNGNCCRSLIPRLRDSHRVEKEWKRGIENINPVMLESVWARIDWIRPMLRDAKD